MRFAIGDVHGELKKLENLIHKLESFKPSSLFFVGDYIDKGSYSKETVEYLAALSKSIKCVFLIGNHEYAWLEFIKNGRYEAFLNKHGAQMAARSFGITNITPHMAKERLYEPHKAFFDSLLSYVELEKYIISHSGLKTDSYHMPLDKIPVESFLFARYDFLANEERYMDKKFIAGHTGFYYPFCDNAKICIDTGAVYLKSAPLTAFCIDEEFFADSNGEVYDLIDLPQNCRPSIIKERES